MDEVSEERSDRWRLPHRSRNPRRTVIVPQTVLLVFALLRCGLMVHGQDEDFTPSFTFTQCTNSIIVSDLNRDDYLTQAEYVRFLNRLTANLYLSDSFATLTPVLQANYQDLASSDNGQVSVAGAKPGQTPSDDEATHLELVCSATDQSIQEAAAATAGGGTGSGAENGGNSTEPAPAPVPTPTSASAPAPPTATSGDIAVTPIASCNLQLAISDGSRNGMLDANEYVVFLNRVDSAATWSGLSFDGLPVVLQSNFIKLAGTAQDEINLSGTRPGQTPTDEEAAFLDNVCTSTATALAQALADDASGGGDGDDAVAGDDGTAGNDDAAGGGDNNNTPPATAPSSSGNSNNVTSISNCNLNLAISDASRNTKLDDTEYVTFVNRVGTSTWDSFAALPVPLQENFETLAADGGEIDIDGTRPGQSTTDEQAAHLATVCDATAVALQQAAAQGGGGGAEPTPTPTPTPAPATLSLPTNATIYNAFVVSNVAGLSAASLLSGKNRNALDEGYGSFVKAIISKYLQGLNNNSTSRLLLRHHSLRRLDVTSLVAASAVVYEIQDLACPKSVANANAQCQIVFASFQVEVVQERNTTRVVQVLTDLTQGELAERLPPFMIAAVAETDLQVVGPSATLRPAAGSGNDDDDDVPDGGEPNSPSDPGGDKDSGSGKNMGMIIGIVAGIVVCCGGCVCMYGRQQLQDMLSDLFQRKNGAKDTDTGANDDRSARDSAASSNGDDDDEEQGPHIPEGAFGRFDIIQESPRTPSHAKSSGGGITNIFGRDMTHKTKRHNDDDGSGGFSVQEQSPAGESRMSGEEKDKSGMFNAFGFKKKQSGDAFDSTIEAMNSGNDQADFANYAFDDPAVGSGQGSVGDLFGGGVSSKGNSGWNSSSGEDAFANQDASSRSGSSRGDGGRREPPQELSGSEASERSGGSYDDDESDSTGSGGDDEGAALDDQFGFGSAGPAPAHVTDNDMDHSMSHTPSDEQSHSESSDSRSHSGSGSYSDEHDTIDDSQFSMTSEERQNRTKYRAKVEALVRKVVPEQFDNIDNMMNQFLGREAELLNTLQTMYERSSSLRARKAVHKSKAIPVSNSRFTAGGTDGSAAIAAASTLGTQTLYEEDMAPLDDDEEQGGMSAAPSHSEEQGSYYSEDEPSGSGSGSYDHDDDQDDGRRDHLDDQDYGYGDDEPYGYNDDDQQGDEGQSQYSGSYDDDNGGSQNDRSGSYSGSGSYDDDEEGSYYDD